MNFADLKALFTPARQEKHQRWKRHVSIGNLVAERHEIAQEMGFGEGTTCYDDVLILGDVKVGKNCWIGPFVILDGSGGLEIGDYVDISAGAHIYTHNTVQRCVTMGKASVPTAPVKIGSGVYIGPHAVICQGVTIGDGAIIGAGMFVDKDVPPGAKVIPTLEKRIAALERKLGT